MALAIVLFVAPLPTQAAEQVVLQLKWFHQFQFAGYYAAKEKGFYAAEGLDVDIRPRDTSEAPVDSVLDGDADFGISDASLILHRLQGRKVVVLAAVFQHSPLVLLTRASDNILGPHELRGKRVMRQGGIDDAALTAMFDQEGIAASDIQEIPHTFDDEALLKGQTDAMSAYLTNQPYLYRQRDVQVNVINPLNYGIDFYGDMLFTSEALMRDRPELAIRFRRASLKGWQYALDHPEEVVGWLTDRYGSKKSADHLRYEARMTDRMIVPDLVEIGHLNVDRFHRIADIYRQQRQVPADAVLHQIDYRDYLKADPAIPDWMVWVIVVTTGLAVLSVSLVEFNRHLRNSVAERTRELQIARDNLQRYVDIVDKHVITSSIDPEGIITDVSDAFARVSGYTKEELVGQPFSITYHPDVPKPVLDDLWSALHHQESWSGEVMSRAKDGSTYWVDINVEPDFDPDGAHVGHTTIRRNITDEKRVAALSETDGLTGLANRRKLNDAFATEIQRTERYGHPLSVILLDIDRFKRVNDTYGHLVGDDVLVEFTKLIHRNIRATDIAGRWGGEEFAIICPGTETADARILASHLREAISAYEFPEAGRCTASFGVAGIRPGDTTDTIMERADAALYRAKETGRNRVELAA